MTLTEFLRLAWDSVTGNKMRSLLTMLGIIIGVASVIIMISISAGTEVDFGALPIGQELEQEFTIINLSLQQLELTEGQAEALARDLPQANGERIEAWGQKIFAELNPE